VAGNTTKAHSVIELVAAVQSGPPSARDILPNFLARWARLHLQQQRRAQLSAALGAPAAQGDGAEPDVQSDPSTGQPGGAADPLRHSPSKLSLSDYPHCYELIQLVRQKSAVATETPLMVLNQYASQVKLEIVFHETNLSSVGPFTARACLVRAEELPPPRASGADAPPEPPPIAEATGMVSNRSRRSRSRLAAHPAPHRRVQRPWAGAVTLAPAPPGASTSPLSPRPSQPAPCPLLVPLLQATTKKVARQIAAAAILEALLESTPMEAFFASMHSSSSGGGAGAGAGAAGKAGLEHDLAVGLYGPDTGASSAALLQALAHFPKCQQMLVAGAAGGAALCTPAMTLYRYSQRVRALPLLLLLLLLLLRRLLVQLLLPCLAPASARRRLAACLPCLQPATLLFLWTAHTLPPPPPFPPCNPIPGKPSATPPATRLSQPLPLTRPHAAPCKPCRPSTCSSSQR
jgi:hypothetical protein